MAPRAPERGHGEVVLIADKVGAGAERYGRRMDSPGSFALRSLGLLGAAMLVGGCVTPTAQQYAKATSGLIGCPSSEIAISEQVASMRSGTMEWRAECRGQKFFCSGAGKQYACTPELAPAAAPK